MALKGEGIFAYHIIQERERKNLAILELIRKKGPISRAEISRTLGLNIVTISNYVDFYVNKRIILEVGLDVSSGGRRPELLELNAKSYYVVGVDISPDTILVAVTDLKVSVVHKVKVPRPDVSMEELAGEVIRVIAECIQAKGVEQARVKNIGIGISGIVDYPSGTIHDTDPARGRTRTSFIKFTKAIEEKFNIPVYIGNDASCAVFGEKTLNPSADVDNMVYVYSDVGCGILIHGDVYCGSTGCAGETQLVFGEHVENEKTPAREYTYLRPWGVDLGTVCEARKAIEKGEKSEIFSLAKGVSASITKETIVEAARKKDKLALDILGRAGANLGVRVAFLVNLLNPDIVIIGGGVERVGDILLDPVRRAVKKMAFDEPANAVKIIPTFLGENAVVLGAAALAAREVFINA